MANVKKILFVSCSAGAGHKRAAEALRLACALKYPKIEARHIDLVDYSDWLVKKTVSSTYHFLAKHLPAFYGLLYKSSDTGVSAQMLSLFISLFKINTRKLHQYVDDFAPDRLVSTHFIASAFLKKHAERAPLDMVITDYELNRIVLDPEVRKFYAPNEEVKNEILGLGRRAHATGIPLHPEFLKHKNPDTSLADFGITRGRPTILVMTGGCGLADPAQVVKSIVKNIGNINLIVITGKNNPRTFARLNRLATGPSVTYRVIDFTERIDELIRLADLIITKPGGLTVTECLAMKKPVLLMNPIPGQEVANVRYIEKNNYGRLIADHNETHILARAVINGDIKFAETAVPLDSSQKILEKILS